MKAVEVGEVIIVKTSVYQIVIVKYNSLILQ